MKPRCLFRHRWEPRRWGVDEHGISLEARVCSRCERLEVQAFGMWVKVKDDAPEWKVSQ